MTLYYEFVSLCRMPLGFDDLESAERTSQAYTNQKDIPLLVYIFIGAASFGIPAFAGGVGVFVADKVFDLEIPIDVGIYSGLAIGLVLFAIFAKSSTRGEIRNAYRDGILDTKR